MESLREIAAASLSLGFRDLDQSDVLRVLLTDQNGLQGKLIILTPEAPAQNQSRDVPGTAKALQCDF